MAMNFKQYDVVRLKGIPSPDKFNAEFDLRSPVVGDVATIVEVYKNPPGYELECSDSEGVTQWLIAWGPDEIELELLVAS